MMILSVGISAQKKQAKAPIKQTEKQKALESAKIYFEKYYMPFNFKDPYSYELKKITIEENTTELRMTQKINHYSSIMKRLDTLETIIDNKKEYRKIAGWQKQIKDSLSIMPDVERKAFLSYSVFIDAYGANSYGNKVLGRYVMKVAKDGKPIGEIIKL